MEKNNYKKVIIERFFDDCRTYTIKDPNNSIIEKCSFENETLKCFYSDNRIYKIEGFKPIINFISFCTLEDE